jgi:DeoR family transcriptional regulator of aga operon
MIDTTLSKGKLRRQQIMHLLKKEGRISVQDIIFKLNCSEATARRDLDLLARTENVIRTIGGAQLEQLGGAREFSFSEKKQLLWVEKESIARTAATFVNEGDVIGLSGGTTTFLLARELKLRNNITVVTNAVNIAMELAESDGIQVVLTGGVMRKKSYELCGPLAESSVQKLNIGTMFIGIDGISAEQGITTYSELEAEIGRMLIQRSSRTIAVFDQSKVGKTSLFSIVPLSSIHGCVTDTPMDQALENKLNELHIDIHYVAVE